MQKFFKRAFVSVKVIWMFVLSLWLMIDENKMDVDGDSLEIFLKIFLKVGQKVYIISEIISSNMNHEIVRLFLMSSSFSRIFSLVPPGKFTIFTLWLTLRPFSEIRFTMESPEFSFSYPKILFEFLFFVLN